MRMATTRRRDVFIPVTHPADPDVMVPIRNFATHWRLRNKPGELCTLVVEASSLQGLGYQEFAPGKNPPSFMRVLGTKADYTFVMIAVDERPEGPDQPPHVAGWRYAMIPQHAAVSHFQCEVLVVNS